MLPGLLMSSGSLIHNDGTVYDVLFKMFDFLKGSLTLGKKYCVFFI